MGFGGGRGIGDGDFFSSLRGGRICLVGVDGEFFVGFGRGGISFSGGDGDFFVGFWRGEVYLGRGCVLDF